MGASTVRAVRKPRPNSFWWVIPKGQELPDEDAQVQVTKLPDRQEGTERYRLTVRAATDNGRKEANDLPNECTAQEFFLLVMGDRLWPVDRNDCWQ